MMQVRNPDITKQKILLAAEAEFASLGLHGARINIIAEKSGVNKRMIYHYYCSKEGLYESVLEYNFKKIANLGNDELFSGDDVEKGVREIISRYFSFLSENPNYVKIKAWEEVSSSSYNKKTLIESLSPAFHQTYEFYRRGCELRIFKNNINLIQLIISAHAMCFISFTQQDILKSFMPDNTMANRLEHICQVVLCTLKNEA